MAAEFHGFSPWLSRARRRDVVPYGPLYKVLRRRYVGGFYKTGGFMSRYLTFLVSFIIIAGFLSCQQAQKYSLTGTVSPSGAGTITLNPANGTYESNTNVTITATASSGYVFSSWSGDASGSDNTVSVTMTSDKSVTANFTSGSDAYSLTAAVNPAGGGTVTLNPAGGSYNSGASVSLTATVNSGYTFANWSGDASGSDNPVSVTMTSNKSVTANFTSSGVQDSELNITIGTDSYGHTDVILENSKIRCHYTTEPAPPNDETCIKNLVIKSVNEDQAGGTGGDFLDEMAGSDYTGNDRGVLSSAVVTYDGNDKKTVRLEWDNGESKEDVTIFLTVTF